jgi:hypothetical protein
LDIAAYRPHRLKASATDNVDRSMAATPRIGRTIMRRQSIQRLAVAALAAGALATPAAAVAPIRACGILDKAGETTRVRKRRAGHQRDGHRLRHPEQHDTPTSALAV